MYTNYQHRRKFDDFPDSLYQCYHSKYTGTHLIIVMVVVIEMYNLHQLALLRKKSNNAYSSEYRHF